MILPLLLILQSAAPPTEMQIAVEAILEHEGDAEQRVRALRRLGDEALIPLWDMAVESLEGESRGAGLDEVGWTVLVTYEPKLLRGLMRTALEAPTMGTRLACLQVLQRSGTSRDLGLALHAADSGEEIPLRLSRALADTVAEMLRRDSGTYRKLRESILGAPEELRFALVRSLGEVRNTQSLDLMAFLIGFDPDLDVVLLAQITVVADELPKPIDAGVRDEVRELLGHESARVVQAAARAAGALGDADAAERLVEMLGSDDRGVSSSAHWALSRLTGLRLPADARRWQAWYTAERAWFEGDARDLYDDLRSDDLAVVVRAVKDLSAHRLRRHEIAAELAVTLTDDDPQVRSLGCAALVQLDSTAALSQLVTALGDHDDDVVRAAWHALQRITRRDLPPEPEVWAKAIRDNAPVAG